MTAMVWSNASSMPDSNSSGTSTTAAGTVLGLGAERGHPLADERPQQALQPFTAALLAERGGGQRGAIDGAVLHDLRKALGDLVADLSEPYSSCTTASVESVAAPSSSRHARAVDFPAPSPPVRPMKGTRAAGSST